MYIVHRCKGKRGAKTRDTSDYHMLSLMCSGLLVMLHPRLSSVSFCSICMLYAALLLLDTIFMLCCQLIVDPLAGFDRFCRDRLEKYGHDCSRTHENIFMKRIERVRQSIRRSPLTASSHFYKHDQSNPIHSSLLPRLFPSDVIAKKYQELPQHGFQRPSRTVHYRQFEWCKLCRSF